MEMLYTLLAGSLTPFLVNFITELGDISEKKARFIATISVSGIIGVIMAAVNGLSFTSPEEIIESMTIVFAASQVAYKLYFKNRIM